MTCPRRTRRRTPLEIFAAAYLDYARYVDPVTGEACPLETLIERLADIDRATRGPCDPLTVVAHLAARHDATPEASDGQRSLWRRLTRAWRRLGPSFGRDDQQQVATPTPIGRAARRTA